MMRHANRSPVAVRPDPRLVQVVSGALFLGLVALSSLPSARGDSAWFGVMPLWLLGMPLVALAALHLRSRWDAAQPIAMRTVRRGRGITDPQGRRRSAAPARPRRLRVA